MTCLAWQDPDNPLVPFRSFNTLHFARFVILDDATLGDLSVYGPDAEFRDAPIYLAFLGECDGSGRPRCSRVGSNGPATGCARSLPTASGSIRAAIFCSGCASIPSGPTASYVNWIGRTVRQIKEEAELHMALADTLPRIYLRMRPPIVPGIEPQQIRAALVRAVDRERDHG